MLDLHNSTMDEPFIQHFLEIRLGERYQICQRIGSGSFGQVYTGKMAVSEGSSNINHD